MRFLIFISILSIFFGCGLTQKENSTDGISLYQNNTKVQVTLDSDSVNFNLNKIYTDTVIFKQYMDYGDFYRFHIIIKGKDLYPINEDNDRSLNRGDTAILKWKVDSIWIPESPENKWISEISINIQKIKDGKLSLFKKENPEPIRYYFDSEINEQYDIENLDEIYSLVEYYLANSKQPLVKSAIENQSNFEQIQYSIEEQNREEDGNIVTYTVIGLSNHFDNHNSIFQWLYFKKNNNGYRMLYEYDLPNDKLLLFN